MIYPLPRAAYNFFQAVIFDLIAADVLAIKDFPHWPAQFSKNKKTDYKKNSLPLPLAANFALITGVSGGVDSMLLLAFLSYLQKEIPFKLIAAHLNHGLRPQAAEEDQAVVEKFCRQKEIEFYSKKVDIESLAAVRGKGIEEAGRKARYDFFAELGEEIVAEGEAEDYLVCLAHHEEDQAETILLNLGRGSGLEGLIAMDIIRGRILRPFLRQSKNEILEAASALQIPWQTDQSNLSGEYRRNRLRNELLPLWADILSTDPAPLLARLSENLRAESRAIEEMALRLYEKALLPDGKLSTKVLLRYPDSIIGRAVNIAINNLLATDDLKQEFGEFSLSERSQKALLSLLNKDDCREYILEFPEKVQAELFANTLVFSIRKK